MKTSYLDNGASTMVAKEVADAMLPFLTEKYGNASSLHAKGAEASEALEKSRETIAQSISVSPDEIYFTGSATEALNMAVRGYLYANKAKGNHFITTRIEHPAVLNQAKRLQKEGFPVTLLDVDKEGVIDLDQLRKSITPKTLLVSVIHGNHEIGTIQDLKAIAEICSKKNVAFHTDACQSYTKTELDAKKQGFDTAVLNAHKIHGPKGAGALYLKKGLKLERILEGGPHEKNVRPGTENVPAIVGFAKAAEIALKNKEKNVAHMTALRDQLVDGLLKIPDSRLNGPRGEKRLCNNANVSFAFIEGEGAIMHLSERGVYCSTGSACSSHSLEPSHVLTAIGLKHEQAHGSLRLTLSRYTTKQEINAAIAQVGEVVELLRKMSPLSK